MKKHFSLYFFLVFSYTSLLTQTVDIYVWTGSISTNAKIQTVYESAFGGGNVTVTSGNTITDIPNYDVIIFNQINNSSGSDGNPYPDALINALVTHVQNGNHVVISTEGKRTANNSQFMSTVWNTLTGDAITETDPAASGTNSPPRFHNSNGPWGLSPDPTITPSTTSYASFGNLPALSVTHQRNQTPSTCDNVEGLCAVYPSKPNLTDGTLYIQGEIQFPFFNTATTIVNHANALAKMHYTLIANDQTTLNQLNSWSNNPIGGTPLNDTSFCAGALNPFTVSAPNSTSYSWEDGLGNVLDTNQTFTITDTGTYVLKTVALPGECDVNDSFVVTYDSLTFSTTNTPTCSNTTDGEIVVTNVNGLAPFNYFIEDVANPDSLFSNLSNGSYEIKVIDSRGCQDSAIVPIALINAPVANFIFDTACTGNITSFMDQTNTNGAVISTWEWEIDGTTDNTEDPTYTFTSAGPFPVSLKVIASNGCVDSITKNIVHFANPLANFSVLNSCPNTQVPFTNLTTENGSPYPNGYTFLWDFGNGNLSTLANPKNSYGTSGIYNINLQVTSPKGCFHDTILPLEIYDSPSVDFTWTNACLNEANTFTDESTIPNGTITGWSWNLQEAFYDAQNPTHIFSTSGSKTVKLVAESSFGCRDSITHLVEVYALPQATFSTDQESIDQINNSVKFTNTSVNSARADWVFFDGSTSTQDTIRQTIDLTNVAPCTSYTNQLKITSADGCLDSISKELLVNGVLQVFVPTAFSPGTDGFNDSFLPITNDVDIESYVFQVFDRWGELVFETNVLNNAWDGKENGEYLKQDVYVWKVSAKNICGGEELQKFMGNVLLLR